MENIEELILGCKQGSRVSQSELYKLMAPKMFAICLRYAPSTDIAEDYLQDSFIKIFQKIDSYKAEGSFEGWVKRIVVRTILENIRRDKKITYIDNYDSIELEDSSFKSALSLISASDIVRLIAGLPQGYRLVLNLYSIEGYSHKEISDLLGISEEGSRSQLSRSKKILYKKLIELGYINE